MSWIINFIFVSCYRPERYYSYFSLDKNKCKNYNDDTP